jgi:cholesterol transport system auxiliary component
MRWLIGLATLSLMTAAAGCITPRTESLPMHTYQLRLDARLAEAQAVEGNGFILLVGAPQSEPGFDTQRMVYLKRQYELEYYAVNQWADTPARLFSPLLVQSLSRSGAWRAVVPLPTSVRGDFRLDSYGLAVLQEFLQQPSRVRVVVRTQLVDLKDSRIVGARSFEAIEPAPSEDPYGGVLAANRATASILDQVETWLLKCVPRTTECGH